MSIGVAFLRRRWYAWAAALIVLLQCCEAQQCPACDIAPDADSVSLVQLSGSLKHGSERTPAIEAEAPSSRALASGGQLSAFDQPVLRSGSPPGPQQTKVVIDGVAQQIAPAVVPPYVMPPAVNTPLPYAVQFIPASTSRPTTAQPTTTKQYKWIKADIYQDGVQLDPSPNKTSKILQNLNNTSATGPGAVPGAAAVKNFAASNKAALGAAGGDVAGGVALGRPLPNAGEGSNAAAAKPNAAGGLRGDVGAKALEPEASGITWPGETGLRKLHKDKKDH